MPCNSHLITSCQCAALWLLGTTASHVFPNKKIKKALKYDCTPLLKQFRPKLHTLRGFIFRVSEEGSMHQGVTFNMLAYIPATLLSFVVVIFRRHAGAERSVWWPMEQAVWPWLVLDWPQQCLVSPATSVLKVLRAL